MGLSLTERFERFKSFFLSKNAKRIMDSPVKDTSNPLNKNENRKVLKDEQKIYEQELQKMVRNVILDNLFMCC